jgi:hypothetical protein
MLLVICCATSKYARIWLGASLVWLSMWCLITDFQSIMAKDYLIFNNNNNFLLGLVATKEKVTSIA